MAIKVHGSPFSSSTLRVVAVLHEKEVAFEFVAVDLSTSAHKQPPFLSLNPFGLVPAFEDGSVKLIESRAITRYIAYKYESQGTPLIFKDWKQMSTLAVWLEVEAHQFNPVVSNLGWLFDTETDMAIVEANKAKVAKVLDIYEAHLAQSKYLAGESFTLADLHHLPRLHKLMATPLKKLLDERTHVRAWYEDIRARPSWQKSLAIQHQAN